MKRKLISAALCATMVGSLLAGSAMTAFADEAADNGDIKIGVSIWSSTDVLGSQCIRAGYGFRRSADRSRLPGYHHLQLL